MVQYSSVKTMWQAFTTTGLPGQVQCKIGYHESRGLIFPKGSVGPSPSGMTWNGALAVTRTLPAGVRGSCVCFDFFSSSVGQHDVHLCAWLVLSQSLYELGGGGNSHPEDSYQVLARKSGFLSIWLTFSIFNRSGTKRTSTLCHVLSFSYDALTSMPTSGEAWLPCWSTPRTT
jgi:hypothetical protein